MLEIPTNARKQAETIAEGFLETIIFQIQQKFTSTEWEYVNEETFGDYLQDLPVDDTNAIGLDLEDQLCTIENSQYAEDDCSDYTGEPVRYMIEFQCCHILHLEAQAIAQEVIAQLCAWRQQYDLESFPVLTEHPFGEQTPISTRDVDVGTAVLAFDNEAGLQQLVWRFRHELLEVFVLEVEEKGDEEEAV
jgi:hypothetical protein